MKSLMMAVAVVMLSAVSANAADAQTAVAKGQVSADALAQFGLGGMQPLSDAQGMEIRGKGSITAINVLVVKAPSINVQQIAINGCNTSIIVVKKSSHRGGRPG